MADLSPLDKLDDAICEYLAAIDADGAPSAWILAFQTSKIVDEAGYLPLAFRSDYTMGAATSPETAMGLAHLTAARIEGVLIFNVTSD